MNAPAEASILVVDDDDAGRYVKAHTLARCGYRVSEAALAQTAIPVIQRERLGQGLLVITVRILL